MAKNKLQTAWVKRCKLYAEGRKLHAEVRKLYAEGDLVFINAVLEVHGDVEIKWTKNGAIVEGVTYTTKEGQDEG